MIVSQAQKTVLVRAGCNRQLIHVEIRDTAIGNEFRRGQRVIVDYGRGEEVGHVVGTESTGEATGFLVRPMAVEDELLDGHLREIAESSLEKSIQWLEDAQANETLLEIEPMLDCQTVFFHFLAPPTSPQIVDELLKIYSDELDTNSFVERVRKGCGPTCGQPNSDSRGCGSNCSTCKVKCSIPKSK